MGSTPVTPAAGGTVCAEKIFPENELCCEKRRPCRRADGLREKCRSLLDDTDGSEGAGAYQVRDPDNRVSDKETIMIGKLPVLGFAFVTALSSVALAREPHHSQRGPAGYDNRGGNYGGNYNGRGGHDGRGRGGWQAEYSGQTEVDLRYADLNRDGWVTMQEALDSGRQVFHRSDRNNDRVLTRHEVGRPGLRQEDRNNDGRVSMQEHQRSVRAQFASLDGNRDGFLARYELGLERQGPNRSVGWWNRR
jgi:hypothetical protein